MQCSEQNHQSRLKQRGTSFLPRQATYLPTLQLYTLRGKKVAEFSFFPGAACGVALLLSRKRRREKCPAVAQSGTTNRPAAPRIFLGKSTHSLFLYQGAIMKLCSYQVDLCVADELDEMEQDRLLAAVDALNLPSRLRRCVRATLDHFLAGHGIVVTVED
jgi:hypothetical protein